MNLPSERGYCPFCLNETPQKFWRREPATRDTRKTALAGIFVDLVRCSICKSLFVQRAFPEELLAEYYRTELAKGFEANLENFYWWLQHTEVAFRDVLKKIADEPRYPLLDVGCGRGVFLFLARKQGWPVTGVEINPELARFVSRDLGIDCICGAFDDKEFPEEYFGIISLIDVLEHLYEPVKILWRCRELLRPGGLVLVKSPYWKMQYFKEQLKYRLYRGPGDIANLGHINQFEPMSLSHAFQKAGFNPVAIFPANSFLPAISGTAFNLKRTVSYGLTSCINQFTALCHRATGLLLSFNLLGIARKGDV